MVQEREAMVQRREEYRRATNYAELQQRLERALTAYTDDCCFGKLAREFYVAGMSRITPRRRNERLWVFGEDESRSRQRVTIIECAQELDEIDLAGGFDSAVKYNDNLQGPARGDNHTNRTWRVVLRADVRLLDRVIARRKTSWGPWLRRAVIRTSVPLLFVVLGVLSMIMTGVSGWSAAAWIATMCSIPITWICSNKRDSFIEAVTDARGEHTRALVELTRQVDPMMLSQQPNKVFTRDPSKPLLSDLLR